jgi:hypothetical protein
MRSRCMIFISLLLVARAAVAEETTAAKKYESLLAEYEQEGGIRSFAKRFLSFAEENVKEPAAADAMFWIIDNVPGRREAARAIELLTQNHANSEKMGTGCKVIAAARTVGAEKLLHVTLEKNKDKQIRAQACFYLGKLLDREAIIVDQLKANPTLAPRVLQYYGKEYGDHLASLEPAVLAKSRETVYARMLQVFPDVEIEDEKIGDIAEYALHGIRELSVGKIAPEIKGKDIDGKAFKLSDYRGKVIMLSFWGHW